MILRYHHQMIIKKRENRKEKTVGTFRRTPNHSLNQKWCAARHPTLKPKSVHFRDDPVTTVHHGLLVNRVCHPKEVSRMTIRKLYCTYCRADMSKSEETRHLIDKDDENDNGSKLYSSPRHQVTYTASTHSLQHSINHKVSIITIPSDGIHRKSKSLLTD